MFGDENGCTLYEFCRRFVLALVVILIVTGTFLLENENTLHAPHPRVQLYDRNVPYSLNENETEAVLAQGKAPSIEPMPFNYSRTKEWGKFDKENWKKYYGDFNCNENPKRHTMKAIFRTWLKLARELNIQYAFYFGSLLGIVRNNDLNPWDHDMDILVPYGDILKIQKVAWPRTKPEAWHGGTFVNYVPNSQHNVPIDDRRRWDCYGKPVENHVDKCSIQEPLVRLYNGVAFLDVFSFYSNNKTLEFITEGYNHVIKKEDFYPLRQCIFMGFDGWCPNNPDPLLKDNYGANYMTPIKKCKNGHWV